VDNFQKLQIQRKSALNKGLAGAVVAGNLIISMFHSIASRKSLFTSDFYNFKNLFFPSILSLTTLQKAFVESIFTFNPAAYPPALPL
jgi:hypothetical protein